MLRVVHVKTSNLTLMLPCHTHYSSFYCEPPACYLKPCFPPSSRVQVGLVWYFFFPAFIVKNCDRPFKKQTVLCKSWHTSLGLPTRDKLHQNEGGVDPLQSADWLKESPHPCNRSIFSLPTQPFLKQSLWYCVINNLMTPRTSSVILISCCNGSCVRIHWNTFLWCCATYVAGAVRLPHLPGKGTVSHRNKWL